MTERRESVEGDLTQNNKPVKHGAGSACGTGTVTFIDSFTADTQAAGWLQMCMRASKHIRWHFMIQWDKDAESFSDGGGDECAEAKSLKTTCLNVQIHMFFHY